MNATKLFGRLLGYDDVTNVDSIRLSFGSTWAHEGPAWVLFGCLGLIALSVVFYLKYQTRARSRTRLALAGLRGLLLSLLFLILADPILEIRLTNQPKPVLWMLFDGSASMAIQDELPEEQKQQLSAAVGLPDYLAAYKPSADDKIPPVKPSANTSPSRMDYVRALVSRKDDNLISELAKKFRLRAYLFDRPDGVRPLQLSSTADEDRVELPLLRDQLTSEGQVTAIGTALDELALRHATGSLAGVLLVSDFDQNSGTPPETAAVRLKAPVFTLGIGPRSAIDLAVDLQTPPKMKKAEQSSINVTLRPTELDGQTVTVRVTAVPASAAESAGAAEKAILIGERDVRLDGGSIPVEFPFTPEETGRFIFTAQVDPLEGEIVDQNNRAVREVLIIDDFLRLLYIEHEPTWEWRFVKEVFHRDKLVGIRGFRTFLRSSDPSVRRNNALFLTQLRLPRSEFFEYDVIFLGDMRASSLQSSFCEMVKEFVSQFGGGLVVIAGPQFGPGELAMTPLADMLPVIVDPDAQIRDDRDFQPRLTSLAAEYDFMRLGKTDEENAKAWDNLGRIPWYQPVKSIEPTSVVLLEHPTDTCVDGTTPQPLIVRRKYGRGEVVYVGFNEMWRIRRKYGELYYRQFWGQMIHRLGLSHALGSQKRFVVRTDRQKYQPDDKVLLTIEAYDENFEPLTESALADKVIQGELLRPANAADSAAGPQPLRISEVRPGLFEARIPVLEAGEYGLRITDPITSETAEARFEVANLSIERRSAVRNFAVQEHIAAETGGKTYELDTARQFLKDFNPQPLQESTVEIFPIWSTWLAFLLVVGLMLSEWFLRKMVNLA